MELIKPSGPFAEAVISNNFMFISGQVGLDENDKPLEGIEAQTEQTLNKIREILNSSNLNLQNVVRMNVYLTNKEDFSSFNTVYLKILNGHTPARTTIIVQALPLEGCVVEIDAIAEVNSTE